MPVTAGDELTREIQALRGDAADGAGPKRRFSVAQTGCNGSVFIRFEDASLDPVALVDRAMEQSDSRAAPHVVRMLPVHTTCSARTPDMIAAAVAPLAVPGLGGFTGTYAVQWRRRCNSEVDKAKVIDALAVAAQSVAPKATVDLKHAEAAIVAEVIKTTCCLSVLPRWREFKEYNLRAVAAAADEGSAARTSGGSGRQSEVKANASEAKAEGRGESGGPLPA